MHWGSGWGARFDAKGHGVADCSHPVKGFATLDCLLPICCAAVKASMDKHGQALLACNPLPTSYPALTLLTFWVTFCVTFHLTNTVYDAAVSVESLHHFMQAEKIPLYVKLRKALKQGGYFILTDYFAMSEEEELFCRSELLRLKKEQNIADEAFYHYDTPLTVEHEKGALIHAGFSSVTVLKSWGATYTLKAVR